MMKKPDKGKDAKGLPKQVTQMLLPYKKPL